VDTEFLDLQTAADRLGVHYQTAYKWVRSGQLPAELVCQKYLVDPAEVDALSARRQQPSAPTVRRPRGGFGPTVQQFTESLLDGNEGRASGIVERLISDGVSLTVAIHEVIAPSMLGIGLAWEEGKVAVWQEHRASGIVERILGENRPNPRGRRRGTAMVAAVEGELHALPAAMAAAALREDNWRVHLLGANLPTTELLDFCENQTPCLAVITVSLPTLQERAETVAIQVRALGIRSIVGCPGSSLLGLQELARSTSNMQSL